MLHYTAIIKTKRKVLNGFFVALLATASLAQVSARAHAHEMSMYQTAIQFPNGRVELREVFSAVEKATDFSFIYSADIVDLDQKVNLTGKERSVGEVLDVISTQTTLAFKQVENTIVVRRNEKARKVTPPTGGIRGRIVDSQTGEALPGASITVKGTLTGTSTDVNGEFLLRLPSGELEIEISYIGYQKLSQKITVGENQLTSLNFQLLIDATQLESIIISGSLQGQQKALNQQKSAENIKNIVSADQIGRFPDPNVAEALQRVPAVNIERDQGEGRYVLVRGLAPQFTNININGEQIPSPEAGVRFVALDAVPADQLSSIEVSKALTPDMDGDAIGGSVNLITRKAQAEKTDISASLLGGYNQIVGRTNLQGSLQLGKRFFGNKLGVMINSSYYETDRGSDNWERDDNDLELRDYELLRTRLGLSSTIDYKLNEKHEVYFRTIYNRFTDREWRRRYIFVPNADDSPFEENSIERSTKDRLEKQIVGSYNLGAKHTFSKVSVDYEVAYSRAVQDTPFDVEVGSAAEVDDLSIDFDSNKKFPYFHVNGKSHKNPDNIYLDNSIYEFDELASGRTYALDVNKTAKVNISLPVSQNKGILKFGGKVRLKDKEYDVTENVFSWEGGNVSFNGFEEGDYTLEKFAGGTVDKSFLDGKYSISPSADVDKVIRHFNANQSGYAPEVDDKLAAEAVEAFEASEDVYAGYAMARFQFNKLMVLGGVRYEKTNVTYSSKEVVYDFEGELQEIVPVEGSSDYSFLLPQLHLKYTPTENINFRFAATRSYARPNFQDIVPSQEIELSAREGMIGNPALKPVSATNIDLMAEKYFGNVGIVSAGIFYKRLNNFIFNTRFETDAYPGAEGVDLTLTQAQNGKSAELVGVEVAFQRNLTFLPGALQGLSVYANYTLTNSRANIQSRAEADQAEEIRPAGPGKACRKFCDRL
jgi:TonB-dependent receptor